MSMKRFASSLVLSLTLALPAVADEVRGIISKSDPEKNELVIDGRGLGVRRQSLSFVLTSKTKVQLAGQAGKAADLAAGKRVKVVYEMRDGQRVATDVTVNPLLANFAAPPAPAAPP